MAKEVPIWEKSNLTLEEASAYFGIGVNKLRNMTNDEDCPFVIWCGTKRLVKRRLLDKHLEKMFSI
jgi:excisionase family DNA binding protein